MRDKVMQCKDEKLKSLQRKMDFYDWLSRATEHLKIIDTMFNRWTKIQLKDPISTVLMAAGTVKDLVRHFVDFDDEGLDKFLREAGYKRLTVPAQFIGLFHNIMSENMSYHRMFEFADKTSLTFWTDHIVSTQNEAGDVTQIYATDNELLKKLIAELTWKNDKSLILSSKKHNIDDEDSSDYDTLELCPFHPASVYIGTPAIEDISIKNHDGTSRSIIIIGNTGSGKTTMSHLIAQKIGGNTLKIASREFNDFPLKWIISLLGYLQPSILLLDDIQYLLENQENYDTLLTSLEGLNQNYTVVGTVMNDGTILVEPSRFYYPGMRPGRIDEIILLQPHDDETRKKILKYYLVSNLTEQQLDCLISVTRGLSGAYLKQLSFKIDTCGFAGWEHYVAVIRATAPLSMSNPDDDIVDAEASPNMSFGFKGRQGLGDSINNQQKTTMKLLLKNQRKFFAATGKKKSATRKKGASKVGVALDDENYFTGKS